MTAVTFLTDVTPPLGAAVVAIGVFDGVHIGHQALVRDTVAIAAAQRVRSAVVTFDRDPDQIVAPASAAPQLLDIEDKLDLLSAIGPDVVLVVPFDQDVAAMPPLVFLDDVLMAAVTPEMVVVGHDFRFGHRAEGDVEVLTRYGAGHGFAVAPHELVPVDGQPVTSTRVRRAVAEGDVAGAARLLGRPHRLRGTVVHGRGGGITLGAPTANLAVGPYAALPAHGVYAGAVLVDDARYLAGVSVGPAPTFPDSTADIEVHLIGFDGDLYDRLVAVELTDRLRDQVRFESPDDLADAIAADLERVRRLAGE